HPEITGSSSLQGSCVPNEDDVPSWASSPSRSSVLTGATVAPVPTQVCDLVLLSVDPNGGPRGAPRLGRCPTDRRWWADRPTGHPGTSEIQRCRNRGVADGAAVRLSLAMR